MEFLLFLLLISGVIWFVVYRERPRANPRPFYLTTTPKRFVASSMYRTRSSIMNKSEMAFFFELQKQIPKSYYIFPNIRIADFIDAVDGQGFYKRRNNILPKHIDFLICNSYFKPMIAIEINGSSHRRPDRIERDELIREIFADARLPLEFVDVGTSFVESVARIKAYLTA